MFAAGPPGLGFWIDLDHGQGACNRCCSLAVAITLTCVTTFNQLLHAAALQG